MKRGFKKHIALSTVFSLTLLVGSFQAVPDFKGALSTALNSRVCNNMVTQSLPGQIAMAAAGANSVDTLVGMVATGKRLGQGCPLAGFENAAEKKSVRLGYFTVGVNLPKPVQVIGENGAPVIDNEGNPVFKNVPTLLEKVRSAELFVEGATLPNVAKTVAAWYAASAALNRMSK